LNGHCMKQFARSTWTYCLSVFRYTWVIIKHYTTVWWPTSRFMVAGTSYTHHSQLFSKKILLNEKVAKEPKSSQIKILKPTASQNSQIYGFWVQKSQFGNPFLLLLRLTVMSPGRRLRSWEGFRSGSVERVSSVVAVLACLERSDIFHRLLIRYWWESCTASSSAFRYRVTSQHCSSEISG